MKFDASTILFTTIILSLKSCSNQADQNTLSYNLFDTYITELAGKYDEKGYQDMKFIVIPVNEGCNSCRQEIIQYLKENEIQIKKTSLTIILLQGRSSIQGVNSIQEELSEYTFLIDKDLEFIRYSLGQTGRFYLIHMTKEKVVSIELTTANLLENLPKIHE